ncbi:hydroxydechloroatrazine ethylaminohydrolase [compost metagenome]
MAALVFCTPANVAASVINGREVVRDGALLTADLPNVLLRHRALARTLFERASQGA